ncbi:hypothetical protein LS633_28410 [Pseudomonas sp. NIBR-H-19]|uniref:hypothetical protein n=1 Tax=Pseudomonas sp. NIBR-H-19 TaxID=2901380 RepID=UPI001E362566|nr:hypothetical protein [Pseudomonas sp. NIBR-H-19]UHC82261.1 hypothetical protein LS633_28410 [Pseudomonas sp. NIBR-H-19]
MSFQMTSSGSRPDIQSSRRNTRGTTIALFNAVIMDTPVLDGRLRGDWQTSVGQPASGENGRVDTAGSTTSAEVTRTHLPAQAKKPTSQQHALRVQIEYEGWSKIKAPQGMVRRNVDRFQRLIDEQARKNKV